MIYNLNEAAPQPKRIVFFPRETLIVIQPIAPNPIRIGTSQLELSGNIGNLFDGIQVNPPINNADIFQIRWTGWLWIIAVNAGANSQGVIICPGHEQGV